MFESIEGILKEKTPSRITVATHGIGYRLSIPLSAYGRLPNPGDAVFLYLCQVVREDAHHLFAFLERGERDLFEQLLNLSGIGPKTALALIGHMDLASFHHAIAASDTRLLSKIPGIGKKTAERLVLEMRDKLSDLPVAEGPKSKGSLAADAISALMHLGYSPADARKAVQKAVSKHEGETDLSKVISLSLQSL